MRLRNILITVADIERSIAYYKELFGLQVVVNNGGNVVMTEGLVLQETALWEKSTGFRTISQNNAAVLYFEEQDLEGFLERRKEYCERNGISSEIRSMISLEEISEGKAAHAFVRFYDPDGHLIEVGKPWC